MNQPANILLVDDRPRNLDVLESVLACPDYRLFRAQNANQALTAILENDIAAIVLDVEMPEVDGLELARLIKSRKKTKHIPILFLTAQYREEQDILRGYGVGGVDYMSKPINSEILRSKVAVFVALFNKTKELAEANLALENEIIERKRTEQALRQSLQKEVLLREIHHRVKNSLQIIISLLRMQSRSIGNESLSVALRQSENRIRSMALIHEKLYQSADLARVDFADYVRDLASDLFLSYSVQSRSVILESAIQPISLDLDQAQPCSLVLNELISNALRHAFPDGRAGTLRVSFQETEDGRCSLTVRDNGVGLPPGFDHTSTNSLGLRLVSNLVNQLQGTLQISSSGGTSVEVLFPRHSNSVSGAQDDEKSASPTIRTKGE